MKSFSVFSHVDHIHSFNIVAVFQITAAVTLVQQTDKVEISVNKDIVNNSE